MVESSAVATRAMAWPATAVSGRLARVLEHCDSAVATHLIVAFGLLIRILALARVGGKFLYYENTAYEHMAMQLMAHVHFSPYWPPGVPLYLVVMHDVFGPGLLAARASMLLIYVAFSFALWALMREVASRRAATLAVLAFALYPSYIRWAFNPSTEYPAAACLVAIVWLSLVTLRKRSYLLAVALGLTLGALALVRPNSLALVFIAPAYLWFRTRKPTLALAPLLIAAVMISAWLWKAADLAGRFVFINDSNAQNLFLSNNAWTPLYNTCWGGPVDWNIAPQFAILNQQLEGRPPAERQVLYRRIAIQHIVARPDLFILRTFNRFRAFFCFPIHRGEPLLRYSRSGWRRPWAGMAITLMELGFYWPIMVLAIVFCFNLRAFPMPGQTAAVILGVAVTYALPCFLTCSQPRYNFPVVPLFAVFAFALIAWLPAMNWRDVLASVLQSRARMRAMLLTLAFFTYIQVEWIWIVATAKPAASAVAACCTT